MKILQKRNHTTKDKVHLVKRIVSCLLFIAIILTALPVENVKAASGLRIYNYNTQSESNYTGQQIKVTYKTKKISSDLAPGIILDGVEMASYYDIFSKSRIDADCVYNKARGTITIQRNKTTIVMTLDSKTAKVNGKKVAMPAAPVNLKFKKAKLTKIFVPVEFVTKTLDLVYSYHSSKGEIVIDKKTIRLSYNYGTAFEYTGSQGKVYFDGKSIGVATMPSIVYNGTEMFLAQNIFADSKIGATYKYNEKNGKITLSKNGNVIEMTIRNKTANVNGKKKELTAAPLVITNHDTGNNYVMVPGTFTATSLGYDYSWNKEKKTSEITTKKKKPPTPTPTPDPLSLYGNTSGNINHGGNFAYRDGWLYTNRSDISFLYKYKLDGSERTMLDLTDAKNLNITEDYIYYLSTGRDSNLFRTNLDGTKNRLINNFDDITSFILYDKYIFYVNYSDGNKVYRMNLDGSGRKKLTDDKNCSNLNVTKSYLVYTSNNAGIVRMNQDGTGRTKLIELRAKEVVSDTDYIYFINDDYKQNIYKIKLDGTGLKKLNHDKTFSLMIAGKNLYYQNTDDSNKLYAITLEGKARTKIADEQAYNFHVIDQYLYYQPDVDIVGDEFRKVKITELTEVHNSVPGTGNYAGNIVNGAFTAYYDTKLYQSDRNLYLMSMNGYDYDKTPFAGSEYLNYLKDIRQINVVGDYIYYYLENTLNLDNDERQLTRGIYKVRTDGKEAPIQLTSSVASYLTVVGDWVYFVQDAGKLPGSGPLFRVKIDGTGLSAVNGWGSGYGRALNIIENYMYYVNDNDGGSIYRMRLDGMDVKRLSTEGDVNNIHVYGETIYYNSSKHKKLLKMPIDGGAGTEVLPSVSKEIIVYNDLIYYFVGEAIYSAKLDGTEAVLVVNGAVDGKINISGGYLYYASKQPNNPIARTKLHELLPSEDSGNTGSNGSQTPVIPPIPAGSGGMKSLRDIYLEQGGLLVNRITDPMTYYRSSDVHEINPNLTPKGNVGSITEFYTVPFDDNTDFWTEYTQKKHNVETVVFTSDTPFQSVTSNYNAKDKDLAITVKNMYFNSSDKWVTYFYDTSLFGQEYSMNDTNSKSTTIHLSVLPDRFSYDIKLSEDKKSMFVSVYLNALTGVSFRIEEAYDTLTITGLDPLEIKVKKEEQLLRIFLPDTANGVGDFFGDIDGSLSFLAMGGRNDMYHTGITLSADEDINFDYDVITEGNQVTVRVHRLN